MINTIKNNDADTNVSNTTIPEYNVDSVDITAYPLDKGDTIKDTLTDVNYSKFDKVKTTNTTNDKYNYKYNVMKNGGKVKPKGKGGKCIHC